MGIRRALVWLRRDLRLADNAALYHAAQEAESLAVAFVLSPELLRSDRMGAPIVQFFFSALEGLRARLREHGSDLVLLEGDFEEELMRAAHRLDADALYFNRDTDPAAIKRDKAVSAAFEKSGRTVAAFDDLTYFAAGDVLQTAGKPYTVYTPYRRRWTQHREESARAPFPSERSVAKRLVAKHDLGAHRDVPSPRDYGYEPSSKFPSGDEAAGKALLKKFLAGDAHVYGESRNLPALDSTSHLSPHLRAGTVGIRTCVESAYAALGDAKGDARKNIDVWIGELVWRDFYHQVLVHFPHVADEPFDERGRRIQWQHNEKHFKAWCEGRTGYPIVDAAMRQLNTYGWMHNRLRMVVASFLTKDLLIDWRMGERYFEQHLADGDLAANNGGWQWTASTGTDSAPYFRIFNPVTQSTTYDPKGDFIRKMIPELAGLDARAIHQPWAAKPSLLSSAKVELGKEYPLPIVDHAAARADALAAFGAVFGRAKTPVKP